VAQLVGALEVLKRTLEPSRLERGLPGREEVAGLEVVGRQGRVLGDENRRKGEERGDEATSEYGRAHQHEYPTTGTSTTTAVRSRRVRRA
jgi:hypothetical protein